MLDSDKAEELLTLLRNSEIDEARLAPSDRVALDKFTDYLNFFEFIAYASSGEKQWIDVRDVRAMFDYYLKTLVRIDKSLMLRKYIRAKDYQHLDALLNRYSRIGA